MDGKECNKRCFLYEENGSCIRDWQCRYLYSAPLAGAAAIARLGVRPALRRTAVAARVASLAPCFSASRTGDMNVPYCVLRDLGRHFSGVVLRRVTVWGRLLSAIIVWVYEKQRNVFGPRSRGDQLAVLIRSS